MLSLIKKIKKFKDLEKEIYKYFCELACMFMSYILEMVDEEIMLTRDKSKHRLKNTGRRTTIKTLMGDVEFERRYYRSVDDDGLTYYSYLIDEWIGKNGKKLLTENLKEAIVETALRLSFRKSAELLDSNSPNSISHQTIWNEVQEAGEKVKHKEKEQVKSYLKGELKGKKEVPVLFQEKDGVYLNIQGKKNKKEMKVSKVYEGWGKKTPGSKEYVTIEKSYSAGFEDVESFDTLVNSKISEKYNVEKIKNKIVNADGAFWTKQEAEYDIAVIQQLDLFHIHQAIVRGLSDKNKAKKVKRHINEGRYEDAFQELRSLHNQTEDAKEREKIEGIINYLSSNADHLTRYTERGLSLPEGIEYRGMGTLEGSHHNVICDRMKNRGMSWSIEGAESMAKLLCNKHSDDLEEIYDIRLPGDKDESKTDISSIIEEHQKAIEKKYKVGQKGSTSEGYGCQFSSLPFTGASVTNGRKAIRNMLRPGYPFSNN